MKIHFVSRSLISLFLTQSFTDRETAPHTNREAEVSGLTHITSTPITTDTDRDRDRDRERVCV